MITTVLQNDDTAGGRKDELEGGETIRRETNLEAISVNQARGSGSITKG